MGDIRQFKIDCDAFAAKVKILPETAVRMVSIDLFGRIVRRTPVDTGRARGSWMVSVNSPDRRVLPEIDVKGFYQAPKLTLGTVKHGDTVWITNSLPYIVALEDGHSKRHPEGMVAVSVQEVRVKMRAILRAAARLIGL